MEIRHQTLSNYSDHIFAVQRRLCMQFTICVNLGLAVFQRFLSLCLQAAVYKICKEMYCEGMEDEPFSEDDPDLIGDR